MIKKIREWFCKCPKVSEARPIDLSQGEYPEGSFFWAVQKAKQGHKVTRKWKYEDYKTRFYAWGTIIGEDNFIRIDLDKEISNGRYDSPWSMQIEDVFATDWFILD